MWKTVWPAAGPFSCAIRMPGASKAGLVLPRCAIGVVEDGPGHTTARKCPHIRHAGATVQEHLRAVKARAEVADERRYLAPPR